MNKDGLYPHEMELTDGQRALLSRLFYDEGKVFGSRKFAEAVQAHQRIDASVPHIYFDQSMKWWKAQEVNQRYHQPPKRKDSRQIYAGKVGLVQADSVHMEPYDNWKYIVNVIDVFSRKAWSFPVKDLTSATVIGKLSKLFADIGTVTVWSSDGGPEYSDNIAGYKHIIARAGTPTNSAVVESFNGRVRVWLAKLMDARGTRDWPSLLQTVISNYNNSQHSSLQGMTPNYVHEYGMEDHDDLRKFVRDRDQPLALGTKVRMRNDPKTPNKKGRTTYSAEIYTITKVVQGNNYSRHRYQITSEEGFIQRTYYNNTDFLVIERVEKPPSQPKSADRYAPVRRIAVDSPEADESVVRRSVRERRIPSHLTIYRLE